MGRNVVPWAPLEGRDVDIGDLKGEVRRAARGDEDSAALLFDHYYPRVYRYVFAKLRNHQNAEDVAAETFARVLRRLDRFKWKGSGFEAWLFRIASNLVIDHYRTAGREEFGEMSDTLPADQRTPEETVLATEDTAEMAALIDDLPPDQREVMLLRFSGGLDGAAIAKLTKRNANAVRQLQFRALTNLRKKMAQ